MSSGNELGQKQTAPNEEEPPYGVQLLYRKSGEAGKGGTGMTVKRRGNAPNAPASFSKLGLLFV